MHFAYCTKKHSQSTSGAKGVLGKTKDTELLFSPLADMSPVSAWQPAVGDVVG